MVSPVRRRSFVVIASAVLVGLVAYMQFRSDGSGSSSSEPAAFDVEISSLFVSVENRSGRSLSDIRVAVVPVGRATLFSTTISRLESGEKRDLSLADFRGRDGTPYNARVVRAKGVSVTAKDMDGKEYVTEVPWR